MTDLTQRRRDTEENEITGAIVDAAYLRLLDFRLGLLINFGAPLIKDGIVRLINSSPLRASAPLREPQP